MEISSAHIDNESYWRACCESSFKNCKPEDHGNSWKQAYLETYVEGVLMRFKPDGDLETLRA